MLEQFLEIEGEVANSIPMDHISFNIFIVDDDPFYQEMVSSYLENLGHSARCFSSGEEFLKYLHLKPDLVILDHNLESELRGDDVLRRIKSAQSKIPVIYISGLKSVAVVSDAYKYGSMDFIGKDSESLFRIKLALDKIKGTKKMEMARRSKIKENTILAVSIAMAIIIMTTFVYFHLN